MRSGFLNEKIITMPEENMISANECCLHYNIELSFISHLGDYGLIELAFIKQQQFIPADQLQQLEKFIRMHYDLNINVEGIEAITHLLGRMEQLQQEVATLRNKMNLLSPTGDLSSHFK